jgi:hypothetical protein
VAVILAVGANAGAAQATGPPSAAAATQAFGRWLDARYGNVQGYWTCPLGQRYGGRIDCLAEVRVGETRHLTQATATLAYGRVVFSRIFDTAWIRRWSPYSRHFLTDFDVPGSASVNGPAFDWAWLAQGAHADWQRHTSFHENGYDGMSRGWSRFFDFTCSVRGSLVTCVNAFGDAMRYRPTS